MTAPARGFDQAQAHVVRLSGRVPARATDAAADAARIVLETALRSGDGIPDALVVGHGPRLTSALFSEFARRIGSSLLAGPTRPPTTCGCARRGWFKF